MFTLGEKSKLPMDDLELFFKVVEGANNSRGDLTDDSLRNEFHLDRVDEFIELVYADVHQLHAYPTIAFLEYCAVKVDCKHNELTLADHHLHI